MKGLSRTDIGVSREMYGNNIIESDNKISFWDRLSEYVLNNAALIMGIIILALLKMVLSIINGESILEPTCMICIIIEICCLEGRSSKKMINNKYMTKSKVVRDNKVSMINTVSIVVGDIIKLEEGDIIPADGYIISGEIDVSNEKLNGISEPSNKKQDSKFVYNEGKTVSGKDLIDKNLLFAGSIVLNGSAEMIVTEIGNKTFLSKILADKNEEQNKDLLGSEDKKVKVLAIVSAILVGILIVISNINGENSLKEYINNKQFIGILKDTIDTISIMFCIVITILYSGSKHIIKNITDRIEMSLYKNGIALNSVSSLKETNMKISTTKDKDIEKIKSDIIVDEAKSSVSDALIKCKNAYINAKESYKLIGVNSICIAIAIIMCALLNVEYTLDSVELLVLGVYVNLEVRHMVNNKNYMIEEKSNAGILDIILTILVSIIYIKWNVTYSLVGVARESVKLGFWSLILLIIVSRLYSNNMKSVVKMMSITLIVLFIFADISFKGWVYILSLSVSAIIVKYIVNSLIERYHNKNK